MLLASNELIYHIQKLILPETEFVEIEKKELNFSYFQKKNQKYSVTEIEIKILPSRAVSQHEDTKSQVRKLKCFEF